MVQPTFENPTKNFPWDAFLFSYLGNFIKSDVLYIEMQFADGGTLAQIIASRGPKHYFPERQIISIFEQITSAINYMHSENILHR